MLIDHIGMIFFPTVEFLRIIGRLALPIFAFFIAEGCKYTHDKLHYFVFMALFGIMIMIIQFAVTGIYFGNIFVQFALAILLICVFDKYKSVIFAQSFNINQHYLWGGTFLTVFVFCIVSSDFLAVDYGFFGVMLPFFASIPNLKGIKISELNRFDTLPVRLTFLAIALLALALDCGGIQYFSFFALLILAMYNGKRGERRLKYFFYIFYPLHLVVLYGIYLII